MEFEVRQLEHLLMADEAPFERWHNLAGWKRGLKCLRKNSGKREVHF